MSITWAKHKSSVRGVPGRTRNAGAPSYTVACSGCAPSGCVEGTWRAPGLLIKPRAGPSCLRFTPILWAPQRAWALGGPGPGGRGPRAACGPRLLFKWPLLHMHFCSNNC